MSDQAKKHCVICRHTFSDEFNPAFLKVSLDAKPHFVCNDCAFNCSDVKDGTYKFADHGEQEYVPILGEHIKPSAPRKVNPHAHTHHHEHHKHSVEEIENKMHEHEDQNARRHHKK